MKVRTLLSTETNRHSRYGPIPDVIRAEEIIDGHLEDCGSFHIKEKAHRNCDEGFLKARTLAFRSRLGMAPEDRLVVAYAPYSDPGETAATTERSLLYIIDDCGDWLDSAHADGYGGECAFFEAHPNGRFQYTNVHSKTVRNALEGLTPSTLAEAIETAVRIIWAPGEERKRIDAFREWARNAQAA